MKKSLLVFLSVLLFSAALFAQYGDERRIEFTVLGGFGLGSLGTTAAYSDTWSDTLLTEVNESANFALLNKNSFSLGANLTYYLSPNFGLQIGGAYFAPKPDLTADWAIDWTWWGGDHYSDSGTFATQQAKFSSIPLYLNLVGRYNMGSVDIFASAGPTIFFNSFQASTQSIFGYTDFWWIFQFFDWFDIPLEIPEESWTAFGFNAGAGFDLNVSPSIAITIEGRYYYCPSKEFEFQWMPGTYTSVDDIFVNYDLTYADNFEYVQTERTSLLQVKPSFFSISGGFKFKF